MSYGEILAAYEADEMDCVEVWSLPTAALSSSCTRRPQ